MAKFNFTDQSQHSIRHLPSAVVARIILNPVDGDDYDKFEDCYEHFQFRGNYIIALWDNEEEFDEPEDYSNIRSILRQAFKFYKAHNFIEAYTPPPGPMEDEDYKLNKTTDGWSLLDKQHPFIIAWKDKQFNDTQQVMPVGELKGEDYMKIAQVLRMAGEWLVENHKEKL